MGMVNKKRVTHIRSDYTEEKKAQVYRYNKRRKALIRRLVAYFVVLALVGGSMSSVVASQLDKLNDKQQKQERLEKKLAEAKQRKKELKKRIDQLHNLEYIGKIARRDYLLSDEREVIFSSVTSDKH